MIALLRASASPVTVPALRKALQVQVTAPLAAQLTGENRSERAAMIDALLVGFHLVTRVPTLTTPTYGLEQTLADSLQRLVDQR